MHVDLGIDSSAVMEALSRSPGGAGARERRRVASQTHQHGGHGRSGGGKMYIHILRGPLASLNGISVNLAELFLKNSRTISKCVQDHS